MPRWFLPAFALGVGAFSALAATGALSPLSALAIGAAASAAVLAAITTREPAEAPLPLPPLEANDPAPMPPGAGQVLLARLPTPILLVARSGRVYYANPAAHQALPRLETGSHFAHLIRAPAFVEALSATLSDGDERAVSFTLHDKSERFIEARVALLPAGSAFGLEALALVQIDDRTDARRAEQMRSDFIANASHELRTPLASIIGYIETLQHHARDDPAARERFLGIMAREAGRMQRLVNDLMSLGRIEMTEHLRPGEVHSLEDIAAESAAALVPMAVQDGIDLQVRLDPGGTPVACDPDQLAQVFTNLIDNAMKYGGAGGTVRIARADPGKASPGRVGIAISDSGPGIDREHIPRLTERFYRVSVTSSRNKGGTGLGLAIVKHILNRHGGRLEIASAPGKGSTFTVWLPRADTRASRRGA
ncbi:MAG: ATP-binding protein [Amaricoccus sp.]|uniref:sensor histidine kinase n=1 Tax=Amaricoccus sp. TaxID=1872485 RepID=UPI0039E5481B